MSDEAHSAAAWDGAREVCGQIHIRGKSLADWLDAPGVSPVDGWVEAKPSTTLIAEDIRAGVAKVIDRARQNAVAGALGEVWFSDSSPPSTIMVVSGSTAEQPAVKTSMTKKIFLINISILLPNVISIIIGNPNVEIVDLL